MYRWVKLKKKKHTDKLFRYVQKLLGKDLEKIVLKAEITTLNHILLHQLNVSYLFYIGYLLMSCITQISLHSEDINSAC